MPAEVSFDHLIALKDEISSMKEVVIKSDAKMDVFIATQVAHEQKLGTLESRVDAVESKVSDLAAQRSSDFRLITAFGALAGGIFAILNFFGWDAVKAFIKH